MRVTALGACLIVRSRRAVQEAEQQGAAEKKRALDSLYQDLQQRFTSQLNAQLADQRQALVAQTAREKAALHSRRRRLTPRRQTSCSSCRWRCASKRPATSSTRSSS